MICKTINISGKDVKFCASATIPRLYRFKFGRELFSDMGKLDKAFGKMEDTKKTPENADEAVHEEYTVPELTIFEDVAYIMAKHATPTEVPNTPEEWLDQFDIFSIAEVLPVIIEMWGLNLETMVQSKKKQGKPAAK